MNRFSRTLTVGSLLLSLTGVHSATALAASPGSRSADIGPSTARVISLDGLDWWLAPDPKNAGRAEEWCKAPRPEAKRTRVPWIIQDAFPGYHGVAWYWRAFTVPANPQSHGRYLLRFWAVDYQAEVWLNGARLGGHEGGESPFMLDASDAMKPNATNLLAVRVLNPTHERIDGIVLNETAHRNKALPYWAGSAWDQGGIMDSVEVQVVGAVRINDVFVQPDWQTGVIRLQACVFNASASPVRAYLRFSVAAATGGETLSAVAAERDLKPGENIVETQPAVAQWRLWELNDPFLYRVTARVRTDQPLSHDEYSVRCGFRDFRYERGAFRLNGRRLYLRCSHTGNCCPIGLELPWDPDWLRRDLVNAKAMRFNAIRFIAGVAKRYQLDLCDELGLMVYEESYAGWLLGDSPQMARRFDESVLGMIRRDRNHPSVTLWGLLNETSDGPVFRHAVTVLPAVRTLDPSRLVMLSSGRWDGQCAIGSLSNPGSTVWESNLADQHPYQRVPHTAAIIHTLRTLGTPNAPLFLSEYGVGSAVDLLRVVRHYEQLGKGDADDAVFYRRLRDRFLADWQRWKLDEVFARPEDFFARSNARMAGQRLLGLNAIRSNPNVLGYSLTGTVDQGMTGEGLWTTFRELKPGTVDAVFDGLAPLRWCLFVEPVNAYRGAPFRLEAVLANEDALPPGRYPVRLQVVGPQNQRGFERTVSVEIPDSQAKGEPPMALSVFAEDVRIDGPGGQYRFSATFERGAAAAGETVDFYLADPAELPTIDSEVVLWGEDAGLANWLQAHQVRARAFATNDPTGRELILAAGKPPAPGGAAAFRELSRRIVRGAHVIFLSPSVLAKDKNNTGWLPSTNKGTLRNLPSWLYHKEEWNRAHPVFAGLPAGGLMDYTFYRDLIPDLAWVSPDPPEEALAGGINAAQDYSAGLFLATFTLGAGRFWLNTFQIRSNLGQYPPADHLFLNLLRYAQRDLDKPLAEIPTDFDDTLHRLGLER